MESKKIFTFYSISQALKFERAIKKQNISVRLRPVPRNISSSCGNCAYVCGQDLEKIKNIVKDEKIEYENIYDETGN